MSTNLCLSAFICLSSPSLLFCLFAFVYLYVCFHASLSLPRTVKPSIHSFHKAPSSPLISFIYHSLRPSFTRTIRLSLSRRRRTMTSFPLPPPSPRQPGVRSLPPPLSWRTGVVRWTTSHIINGSVALHHKRRLERWTLQHQVPSLSLSMP